jgi:hypothetical protein
MLAAERIMRVANNQKVVASVHAGEPVQVKSTGIAKGSRSALRGECLSHGAVLQMKCDADVRWRGCMQMELLLLTSLRLRRLKSGTGVAKKSSESRPAGPLLRFELIL